MSFDPQKHPYIYRYRNIENFKEIHWIVDKIRQNAHPKPITTCNITRKDEERIISTLYPMWVFRVNELCCAVNADLINEN